MHFRAAILSTILALTILSGTIKAQSYVEPIEVTDAVARQHAISAPEPILPPFAKNMNIGGRVDITAFIDESGVVKDYIIVDGEMLLVSAVESVLKKWTFKPFRDEEGKVRKAQARLVFQFTRKPASH